MKRAHAEMQEEEEKEKKKEEDNDDMTRVFSISDMPRQTVRIIWALFFCQTCLMSVMHTDCRKCLLVLNTNCHSVHSTLPSARIRFAS
jgi:hypothetical protein